MEAIEALLATGGLGGGALEIGGVVLGRIPVINLLTNRLNRQQTEYE